MIKSSNQNELREGMVLVVSAASGTGKTSLIEAVLASDSTLKLSVSYTTRPQRKGEIDGVDYHFVSEEEFLKLKEQDCFIETAEVFGHLYGTGLTQTQACLDRKETVLLEIDWQGAQKIRKVIPDAVTIFLLPPAMSVLRARLERRGQDSPETIQKRLAGAAEEISHCGEFDYLLINSDFEHTKDRVCSIIRAEQARTKRIRGGLDQLLEFILD